MRIGIDDEHQQTDSWPPKRHASPRLGLSSKTCPTTQRRAPLVEPGERQLYGAKSRCRYYRFGSSAADQLESVKDRLAPGCRRSISLARRHPPGRKPLFSVLPKADSRSPLARVRGARPSDGVHVAEQADQHDRRPQLRPYSHGHLEVEGGARHCLLRLPQASAFSVPSIPGRRTLGFAISIWIAQSRTSPPLRWDFDIEHTEIRGRRG